MQRRRVLERPLFLKRVVIVSQTIRFRPLRWIAAVSAIALALIAWNLRSDNAVAGIAKPSPVQTTRVDVRAAPASRTVVSARPMAATSSQAAAPFHCDDQRIEASFGGASRPQCVAAARPVVNGSTRTYRADARDSGEHWIAVDAAGDTVTGASIGHGGQIDYACEADACAGIVLAAPDLQGSRVITFSSARLSPAGAVTPTSQDPEAVLDGRLTTAMADASIASGACEGQEVLISAQGAPTRRFCPDDGTGVDDGQPQGSIYTFNSVDGPGIAVALDPEGRVRRVDQGAMSCVAPNCSGVEVTPGGANGSRRLVFNGSMLQDPAHPDRWAGLSGRLILP